MRHMAIIADDLTGASDSGVQFARKGFETLVMFDVHNIARDTQNIDVAVFDTDSRAVPAIEAYERVRDTALKIEETRFAHVFKKMDSTLRGNLGAEIDGVMDAIPFDVAVVAPAFPQIGRTTKLGRHYLHGVPIDQTEIARDPKCPVNESDLVKLLASQSKRKVGLVSYESLHAGQQAVYNEVSRLKSGGAELIVFDANTEEDMQRIAESLVDSQWKILWVGSAGLAEYLPDALGMKGSKSDTLSIPKSEKPVLVVAGSVSKVTREQVNKLTDTLPVTKVELNPLRVIADQRVWQAELERCLSEASAALTEGRDVVLTVASTLEQVARTREEGKRLGLDPTEIAGRIADTLGDIMSRVIPHFDLQGLILTGGDTAKAVCKYLGVTGIQLLREVEAGIPLSRLLGNYPLMVVTKAGAFGTEETFVKVLHTLKGESTWEDQ